MVVWQSKETIAPSSNVPVMEIRGSEENHILNYSTATKVVTYGFAVN